MLTAGRSIQQRGTVEQEGPRFRGPRCILICGEAAGIEGVSVIDEALANALVAAPLRVIEHGN